MNQIYDDLMKMLVSYPKPTGSHQIKIFGLFSKKLQSKTNTSINTMLGRVRYALINMRKNYEENQIILTNNNNKN